MSEDFRYKCTCCGVKEKGYNNNKKGQRLQMHHIKPYSEGGLTKRHNLAPLCDRCHKDVHEIYFKLGLGKGKDTMEAMEKVAKNNMIEFYKWHIDESSDLKASDLNNN